MGNWHENRKGWLYFLINKLQLIKAQICKQKSVGKRQAYPKSRPISADKQLIGQNNTSLPKIKTQICKQLISQNNRSLVAYPKLRPKICKSRSNSTQGRSTLGLWLVFGLGRRKWFMIKKKSIKHSGKNSLSLSLSLSLS